MTAPPPLSVVLPVYNVRPFVEESVRSVLAQTFGDFELIIGDDGSDDGTSEVVLGLARRDPRIRVIRRERPSGLAGSANWVVSHARAPIVARMDADDVSLPERLALQMEVLRRHPEAVLVAGLAHGIDESGAVVKPPNTAGLLRDWPFAPFTHSSIMFRRAAFDRVGGYRAGANYWEDQDLYWRLSELGTLLVLPEVVCANRYSRFSVRTREAVARLERASDVKHRCTALFKQNRDWTHLLDHPGEGRVHPRALVARGWIRLWVGERPGELLRLLPAAEVRADLATLRAIVLLVWMTVSPRTLRHFVRRLREARNRRASRHLAAGKPVEWRPRGARAGRDPADQRRVRPMAWGVAAAPRSPEAEPSRPA